MSASAGLVEHALLRDPDWLAHRYDASHDAIQFIKVPRAQRCAVPFLTDDELKPAPPVALHRTEAFASAGQPAPVHFIFHSAYCCSTLLASALDIEGAAFALKEPQILNDLVGWWHRGGERQRLGELADHALTLLARPFAPGEAAVIKPSNVVNGLAGGFMHLRPEARALFLHAPLRTYLTSIARKGMWGRLWVRELHVKQMTENYLRLGYEVRDYLGMTDLQIAAIGWLAQQQSFAGLIGQLGARARSLDSETLVAAPQNTVATLADFFGLAVDSDALTKSVAECFSRNAKDGKPFAQNQRQADQRAGEAQHGDEIDKVAIWAQTVADKAGIPASLPQPLAVDRR